VVDELAPQRDMVAIGLCVLQDRVDLGLGVAAAGLEARPQHPHHQRLHAVLHRPAHQAALASNCSQRLAGVVAQGQRCGRGTGQPWRRCRPCRGLQRLQVAVPGGAGDEVQQFLVAGWRRGAVVALFPGAAQGAGELRQVGVDQRGGDVRHVELRAGRLGGRRFTWRLCAPQGMGLPVVADFRHQAQGERGTLRMREELSISERAGSARGEDHAATPG
jgi:hypothetical protein